MKKIALLGVVLLVAAVGLWAQDVSLPPTYGDVELEADFRPDPYIVQMEAGGPVSLAGLGYEGHVYDAPDVDLYYTAGGYPLTIKVANAAGDTVLLVNAPNGQWYYNDDTNGMDPAITFSKPESGLYDIWVGTYESGQLFDVQLHITEIN